jgi:hypothetical protein
MQSEAVHREVPKARAAVKPVGGLRKWHRGRNLATERSQKPKEQTRGNCGSRRKLVVTCSGTTRRAKVARRKGNAVGKNRTRDVVRGTLKRRKFGRRRQPGRAVLTREQWERSENEHRGRKEKKKRKETSQKKTSLAETLEKRIGDTSIGYSRRTALRREECDGFAQSIKLWSQKNPLLGKHIPEVARSTIELRLANVSISTRS